MSCVYASGSVCMWVKAQGTHAWVLVQCGHFLPVWTWASEFIFLSPPSSPLFHFCEKHIYLQNHFMLSA